MIKEVTSFNRKELFDHFNEESNPFLYITMEVDVTNLVIFCKTHKNFYATMGYCVTKAMNMVDAFKYRMEDDKIYFCDRLKSNYTQQIDEDLIGFFELPDITDYNEYIKEYKIRETQLMNNEYDASKHGIDCVWLSCFPWHSFTGIITPFNKKVTIPQIIWDKFTLNGDKYTLHLMVMAHHGFVDGGHIGKFINNLENIIKNFNNLI